MKPNLEDAERNELIGKLHESFKIDGTIENIDEWGLRDLAYEIKDEKKGYYVVVTISASSTKGIDEFDRIAKINNNVLRHGIFAMK